MTKTGFDNYTQQKHPHPRTPEMSTVNLDEGTSKLETAPKILSQPLSGIIVSHRHRHEDLDKAFYDLHRSVSSSRRIRTGMCLLLGSYGLLLMVANEVRIELALRNHSSDWRLSVLIYTTAVICIVAGIAVAQKRSALLLPFIALQSALSIALVLAWTVVFEVVASHPSESMHSVKPVIFVLIFVLITGFHLWSMFFTFTAYKSFANRETLNGRRQSVGGDSDEDEIYNRSSPFDATAVPRKMVRFLNAKRSPLV